MKDSDTEHQMVLAVVQCLIVIVIVIVIFWIKQNIEHKFVW